MFKTIASTIVIASLFAASADAQNMSGSSATQGGSPDPIIIVDVLRPYVMPYGRDVKWGEGEVTVTTSKGKVKADLKSGAVTFSAGGLSAVVGTISGGGNDNGQGNASITILDTALGMGPGNFTASPDVMVKRAVKLQELPGSKKQNTLTAVSVAIIGSLADIEVSLQRFSLANNTTASTSAGAY